MMQTLYGPRLSITGLLVGTLSNSKLPGVAKGRLSRRVLAVGATSSCNHSSTSAPVQNGVTMFLGSQSCLLRELPI